MYILISVIRFRFWEPSWTN